VDVPHDYVVEGGIYRHARLVTVDPVHVAPDGVFVAPAVPDPGDGVQADATVTVTTDVINAGSAAVTDTAWPSSVPKAPPAT
jgi:hypothetical protein